LGYVFRQKKVRKTGDNWNSATDFSKNLKYGVAINLYNNLYLGLGDVSYGYTNEFYYYNPE